MQMSMACGHASFSCARRTGLTALYSQPHLVDVGCVVVLRPHGLVVPAVSPRAVGVVPEQAGRPAMEPLLAGEEEVLNDVPGGGTRRDDARGRESESV